MIAPHIDTIAIKDFLWAQRADDKWEPRSVPLGEGMVDFPRICSQLLGIRPASAGDDALRVSAARDGGRR